MFLDFAQQKSFCILKNILYPKTSFLYPKISTTFAERCIPKKSILHTPKKWHPNCCTMSNATSGCLCLIMDKQSAQLAQKPADWCGMRPGDQSRPKTMAMTEDATETPPQTCVQSPRRLRVPQQRNSRQEHIMIRQRSVQMCLHKILTAQIGPQHFDALLLSWQIRISPQSGCGVCFLRESFENVTTRNTLRSTLGFSPVDADSGMTVQLGVQDCMDLPTLSGFGVAHPRKQTTSHQLAIGLARRQELHAAPQRTREASLRLFLSLPRQLPRRLSAKQPLSSV